MGTPARKQLPKAAAASSTPTTAPERAIFPCASENERLKTTWAKRFFCDFLSKDSPESLIVLVVYEVDLKKLVIALLCGKMLLSIAEIYQDKQMTPVVRRMGTYKETIR